MANVRAVVVPPVRPEFENPTIDAGEIEAVARSLTAWERLTSTAWVRRLFILVVLAAAWQLYALHANNALMFPTFTKTFSTLWTVTAHGELIARIWYSLQILLMGYAAGFVLAAVFTSLAVSSPIGADLLSTLTSMFNPLPAIALLPLALLWFGLGIGSVVFVTIHSVLWAVALNMHTGFRSVPDTQRMAGENYGLRGLRYVLAILIPAAFPSILAGMKIGWAYAWRTLIAAELVFGATSSSGGLGWFIFEARNELDTARVFAGLTAVILIGLFVESVIFRTIEAHTVNKWGMQR